MTSDFDANEIIKDLRKKETDYYNNYFEKYRNYNKTRDEKSKKLIEIQDSELTPESLSDDVSKLDSLIESTVTMDTKLKIIDLSPFNEKPPTISDIKNTIGKLDEYNTAIDTAIKNFYESNRKIPEDLLKLSRLFKKFMYKFLRKQVFATEQGGGRRRRHTKRAVKSHRRRARRVRKTRR